MALQAAAISWKKALKFLPYITGGIAWSSTGYRQGGNWRSNNRWWNGCTRRIWSWWSFKRINGKRYKNGRRYGNTTSFRKYRKSCGED